MRRSLLIGIATVVAAAAVGLTALQNEPDGYRLEILMPAADGTYPGGAVTIRGKQVGEITDVGVRDNKALVSVELESEEGPLPAGTTARINWDSVIGARVLELLPGPTSNPPLPSGKRITSKIERVELDDVLASLNPATRERLQGVVAQLRHTLEGRETSLNATLRTAGPTVHALGQLMRAVGDDGPAIRELITNLHKVTGTLAQRQNELGRMMADLSRVTSATAAKQRAVRHALAELPDTVRQAGETLGRVPGAVDATVPLLKELRPATRQLPGVARDLSPVLRDLRPTVAMLRPTLADARALLRETPALLDTAHATLPGVNRTVTRLQPAVTFLRPYTPELAGWLSNWTSVFASQTSGNYGRALITASATAFNDNPGVLPPGLTQDPRPAPGSIAGQPWTDANGDGIR